MNRGSFRYRNRIHKKKILVRKGIEELENGFCEGQFRFFLTTGRILDKPKQFLGTTLVVETDGSAEDIIHHSVRDGWEPHYVVIYGDYRKELEILADMLNIKAFN